MRRVERTGKWEEENVTEWEGREERMKGRDEVTNRRNKRVG